MSILRILVIDDSPIHREAAKKQLVGHDLMVVGSYDEAVRLLEPRMDRCGSWECGKPTHSFDVVLVDLLMPASGMQQGNKGMRLVGQEMPVGIFLALLAAKNGAKYVAVFTDSDHHSHPASACFDPFNEGRHMPVALPVAGAQVFFVNKSGWVRNDTSVQPEEVEEELPDGSKFKLQIYPRIKRWDLVLDCVLSPPDEDTDD